ncbi:hypothetical protein ACQY0O_007269 [Thecaphora frezii]
METIQSLVDGKIDFEGQRLADRIYQEILIMVSVAGFVFGYFLQSMPVCMGAFSAALVVSLLAVVPPWPMLNRYHVQWLPKRTDDGQGNEQEPEKAK